MRRLAGLLLALCGTLAVAGVAAPAANAGDVWLWVCQGPEGQPLPQTGDRASRAGGDAAANRCGDASGRALTARPASGRAGWSFSVPSPTTLRSVKLNRNVSLTEGQRYQLLVGDTPLETAAPVNGAAAYDATGSRVAFDVQCVATRCDTPGGAEVSSLAMRVSDTAAPTGAVAGWRNPASGAMKMEVSAIDNGVGLKEAVLAVDGVEKGRATFGGPDPACKDLSSDPASVDLAYGLVGQNDVDFQPVGCITRGRVELNLDTTSLPESFTAADLRVITVTVTDHAGNATTVMTRGTEVINRQLIENIPQRSLVIGSSFTDPLIPQPGSPGGGVQGAQASSPGTCANPALTMVLDQPPLRTTRGVIVLRRNKRYRFAGRLTCTVGGVRRSAPKRTRIDIRTTIGGRTRNATARTGERGAVRAFLRASRSGAVVFRYTSPGGKRSQVTIRFRVEQSLPRGTTIYGRWLRYESPSDRVRFTELEARKVPAGATVTVRCRGSACPGALARSFSVGKSARGSMSLLAAVNGASLRPGAAIDVTITKPGFAGIGKLYCVRSGQKVQTRSYRVGENRPACSAGASAAAKRPRIRGAIRESG
ncbi:hypothetical protein DVA67_030495 [Solirubrobacter sp. CPCC 204708]|uniref:Ig-like domain-containing protein n=1 Tax=Solirubrobacter deserti TaxID=2282478 RepID=A0ABT4RI99_9ACTN|nr:hypothetical protein [Solirubrobacter deserti]MBE2320333.1 hypothetical protein [Solirubrobacter deserti]MDA0138284.1 hypothetical protein [Solirubrobacter deserti]